MQLSLDVLIGSIAGISSAALYAIAVVIYRSQREEIRPVIITAFRMWIALPLMVLLVILPLGTDLLAVSLETVLLLFVAILCIVVVGDTIYLMGQERIGVSLAFPIAMAYPILTYCFAIVFLNDALILSRLFGIIVTVIGIVLISRDQKSQDEEVDLHIHFDKIGLILAALAATLYAAGTVILDASITDIDPISANFIMILCGSIVFVPLLTLAKHLDVQMPTRRASRIIAVTGLFDVGLSFLLAVISVKYVGATIAAVLTSIGPLFAVPISVFYLKEHATHKTAIGVLLTVIGVILVIIGI